MTDVIKASKSADFGKYGKRWNAYNELKQRWSREIELYARQTGMRSLIGCYFTFMWAESDKRRDPDNIVGGGHKIIFDSLVGAGFIPNDGWTHVHGLADFWLVDRDRPGVLVMITKSATLGWDAAHSAFQQQKANE
jgi:hypothetical protein